MILDVIGQIKITFAYQHKIIRLEKFQQKIKLCKAKTLSKSNSNYESRNWPASDLATTCLKEFVDLDQVLIEKRVMIAF